MVQDYERWRKGEVVNIRGKKAELLLKSGAAVITKDMVRTDLKEQ